jgi:hypothetical protein
MKNLVGTGNGTTSANVAPGLVALEKMNGEKPNAYVQDGPNQ